jgi:hypothetical protein
MAGSRRSAGLSGCRSTSAILIRRPPSSASPCHTPEGQEPELAPLAGLRGVVHPAGRAGGRDAVAGACRRCASARRRVGPRRWGLPPGASMRRASPYCSPCANRSTSPRRVLRRHLGDPAHGARPRSGGGASGRQDCCCSPVRKRSRPICAFLNGRTQRFIAGLHPVDGQQSPRLEP